MRRYLSLGLYAEGKTDHAFLQRVLYRATFSIAQDRSDTPVEVAETFVRGARTTPGSSRPDAVVAAFGQAVAEQAITLLFIHTDGGSDHAAAYRESVMPCQHAVLAKAPSRSCAVVAVVPVRETEAWALADVDALRDTWGSRQTAQQLGLPAKPQDVDKIPDPKRVLTDAYTRAVRPRRTPTIAQMIDGLGDRINLDTLRKVDAFRDCEARVGTALAQLWTLR